MVEGTPSRGMAVQQSNSDLEALRKLEASLNADLCARAWSKDDAAALEAAVTIRKLFDGKPLVSGVKALLAHIHGDAGLARVRPPLAPFSAADRAAVVSGHDAVRAKRVA